MTQRPHVVIFNPDEWRGDVLGHVGNPAAKTPNLDQLVATDAVSFRNAFCQNPVCTPSRCSFMSGWYPHVRGHRTMYHMMQPNEPVLLRTLKEHGYFVWWGGKNDLVPGQNGYDNYCNVKYDPSDNPREIKPMFAMDRQDQWRGDPAGDSYYSFYVGELPADEDGRYHDRDWANVDGALEQIRKWGETKRANPDNDQPLCIYLPLTYPHPPYGVEEPWFSSIQPTDIPERIKPPAANSGEPSLMTGIRERQRLQNWSEDRWRQLRATYYAMCARVDYQLGLVVQALKDAGLYDDTALLFFSDHGDFTGDYGLVEKAQNTFQDCLTRVPLIIKPPADIPIRAGVRDVLTELIDVSATIEDITRVPPRHTHFGRSLLPVIGGETDTHRDAVFCEGGRLRGEQEAMELESTSQGNSTGLYWPRISLQTGDGPEHTKAAMCRTAEYKYVRRLYESDELYDLRADPGEEHNLIDDPAYERIASRLSDRMLTWYQETADTVPHTPDRRQ